MRLLALLVVIPCFVQPVWAAPPSEAEMAAKIDARVAELWTRANVMPAAPAEDAEFLRRAWLDLCGIIPPLNDPDTLCGIRGFLAATDSEKRVQLIQRLLAKPSHATHFANVWKNVLLPQDTDVQRLGGEAGFQAWLRGQFADNVSYDMLVANLVLAKGQATEAGPALFYTSLQLKPEELAASTSRAFLGTQIQCAQCHDHPFDHWRKADFWGYAAFFAQLQQSSGRQPAVLQVSDSTIGEVSLPGAKEPVTPRFLGGETSGDGGKTRRERLVQWLTWPENPFVARAAVNRVWALLFGRGLVHPVDDLGAHNACAHPQLMQELAEYFVRTGYDLNCLVRTLTQTKAYQLSSHSPRGIEEQPELFARMAIKSLTAEQLYDCLLEAMRRREGAAALQPQIVGLPGVNLSRQAFLTRFRAPTQGATEYEGGIPQALTLMNGASIRQATDLNQSDLLVALGAPFFTTEQRVEVLFLSTLSRPPRGEERTKFVAYVEQAGDRQALGDVLWALLNSAEFMLNH
jgi:Protein of unknown function (DUF1549)/Protein of unknown function (DUF1553)